MATVLGCSCRALNVSLGRQVTPPHPFQCKLLLVCNWLLLTSFDECFVTAIDNTHRKRSRVNPQGLETAEKSLLAAPSQAEQGQRMQAVFAG